MWWDEDKIESTVDRHYVLSHLLPEEQKRLDTVLGFGDGLTDDTYMDWIDQKAKRIFLILVDLGVPDQIFGVIDDSWDDDDLPLALEQVARLKLTYDRDQKLEKRFYQRQFTYLLKPLQYGDCQFYEDDELVPLELADKRPPIALPNNNVDKVHRPNQPDEIMLRRKISLGLGMGQMPQEEFLAGIAQKKSLEHKHLVTIWASYVHQNGGYVLLTPVSDGTLKSFLTITPPSIKALAKKDRGVLYLNWLHCLASALAFLHSQGLAHRKIKPSNIMLDVDNRIFLNDSGLLTHHQATDSKKSFDKESYDYAAPEQWGERPLSPAKNLPQLTRPIARPQVRNAPPPGTPRASMISEISFSPTSPTSSTFSHAQSSTFSHGQSASSLSYDTESMYTIPFHPARPDPRKSDIFSLGCVILDIVTAFLKRSSRFASHRSAKNKTPGRGGGLPDSSFHKNLAQVEAWIAILAKDASKKEDRLFRGVGHILNLVTRMLSPTPSERPDAQVVCDRLFEILSRVCGIEDACCARQGSQVKSVAWPSGHGFHEPGVVVIEGELHDAYLYSPSMTASDDHLSSTTGSSSSSVSRMKTADAKQMPPPQGAGVGKMKPKAWQTPAYAEISYG